MKEVHAIDFIYECNAQLLNNELRSVQADVGQIGMEWLPINEIKKTLYKSAELLELYKFPRTTHEFLKEYFSEQSLRPYSSEVL